MHFSLLLVFSLIFVGTHGYNSDWKRALGWDGLTNDPFLLGIPLLYPPSDMVESSLDGGFLLCTQPNWAGQCAYTVMSRGCVSLNNDWATKIMSIGTDKGTVVKLYRSTDCRDQMATIYHEDSGVGSLQCAGALIRSISVDLISPTETQPLSILPSFSCQASRVGAALWK